MLAIAEGKNGPVLGLQKGAIPGFLSTYLEEEEGRKKGSETSAPIKGD